MDAQPQVNGNECDIDLDDVLLPKQNDKKKVARKRWAILAKALKVCFFLILAHPRFFVR